MEKSIEILEGRANELELWLKANVRSPEYENKQRELNILHAKIKSRRERVRRIKGKSWIDNGGLNEVSISIKYN
jgi:hypothetical protein